MAFPKEEGVMVPADGVIGMMQGSTPSIKAYNILGYDAAHVKPDPHVKLTNTGLTTSDKGLTICFSRTVSDVGQAGVRLDLTGMTAVNFAAAAKAGVHVHSFDLKHLCSQSLMLVSTVHEGEGNEPAHGHDFQPAATAHGILMILAWVVLLPSGVLFARHRALIGYPLSSRWFFWHRLLQLSGLACFTVAFILIFTAFGEHGEEAEEDEGDVAGDLTKAHGPIGITVACLAGLQLVLAFIRPKPDAPRRQIWNLQHWWTGRVAVILAIINTIIGVLVYHQGFGVPKRMFYIPLFFLIGILVAAAVFLEWRTTKESGWQPVSLKAPSPHQQPAERTGLLDLEMEALTSGGGGIAAQGDLDHLGAAHLRLFKHGRSAWLWAPACCILFNKGSMASFDCVKQVDPDERG
eukprot:CAMPEP_0202918746 /NCGR_PEP_ID=MMETSP1392-20130828/74186_1 /ASSEMBLY_ACC=CAM_ASM_000868 /TAXON_ID=225041 /ORGANISM="Chlamydomonas chlamydogama, Strain SAG 11-48b" /LENGTH=405 /DNA_ID=CAMNT_0049611893 /DNA_START=322 /DNA_END=1536 /DNA_ORIENTATION=-